MSQHLTDEHLQQFRDATAAPRELVRMDRHLEDCPACRDRLGASDVPGGLASALPATDDGTHLTYEQIESYLQSQVDEIDREIVTSHIEFCSDCADRLQNLQSFAAILAEPAAIHAAAAAAPATTMSVWERAMALFRTPRWNYALIGTLASVLVIAILVRERNAQFAGSGIQALLPSTLPEDYRQLIDSALSGAASDIPSPLEQVLAARGSTPTPEALVSPKNEVIRQRRPLFRWQAVSQAETYRVEVRQGPGTVASAMVSGTEWTIDSDLQRGSVYSWTVTPYAGETPLGSSPPATAWFGVISEEQEQRLTDIFVRYPDVGLLKAAASLDAGLIEDAEEELERMNPSGQPEIVVRLSDRIAAIRARIGN